MEPLNLDEALPEEMPQLAVFADTSALMRRYGTMLAQHAGQNIDHANLRQFSTLFQLRECDTEDAARHALDRAVSELGETVTREGYTIVSAPNYLPEGLWICERWADSKSGVGLRLVVDYFGQGRFDVIAGKVTD